MTDPRPGERAPSDAEAARIVQETADVLCDDLGWPFYSIHRPLVRRAIAEAVERWRIYARGGVDRPYTDAILAAFASNGPARGAPAAVDERSTDRATAESTGTFAAPAGAAGLREALEQIARFLQRAGGVHVHSRTNEWICQCDLCSIVKSALASTPAAAPTEATP